MICVELTLQVPIGVLVAVPNQVQLQIFSEYQLLFKRENKTSQAVLVVTGMNGLIY